MTNVQVERSFYGYKIKLNGVLHLWLPVEKDVSIEAWVDNASGKFFIEYTTESRKVRTEYEARDTWMEILTQFEKLLP